MKTKSPHALLSVLIVALAAAVFFTVTGWLLASPSQDITKAVTASGQKNVKAASADAFMNAFSSVLVGVDEKDSAAYVAAAKKLRPDLASGIAAAAAKSESAPSAGASAENRKVSKNRRKCDVCHRGHIISIPCDKVDKFLANHPGDTRGPCTPTPTPTPKPPKHTPTPKHTPHS